MIDQFQFCAPENPQFLQSLSRQQSWEKENFLQKSSFRSIVFEGLQICMRSKDQREVTRMRLWQIVMLAAVEQIFLKEGREIGEWGRGKRPVGRSRWSEESEKKEDVKSVLVSTRTKDRQLTRQIVDRNNARRVNRTGKPYHRGGGADRCYESEQKCGVWTVVML